MFPLLPIHYLIPDNLIAILHKRRPRFSVDEALTPEHTAKWTELGSDVKAIRVQTLTFSAPSIMN